MELNSCCLNSNSWRGLGFYRRRVFLLKELSKNAVVQLQGKKDVRSSLSVHLSQQCPGTVTSKRPMISW